MAIVTIKLPAVYDVSRWEAKLDENGRYLAPIDWDEVTPFPSIAISKATEGKGWVDPSLADNVRILKSMNALHDVYHYFLVGFDPITQANHFIDTLIDAGFDFKTGVLWLDFEVRGVKASQIKAFLDQCALRTGIKPGIYTRRDILESIYALGFAPSWINDYLYWIAGYPGDTERESISGHDGMPARYIPKSVNRDNVVLWQYSAAAIVPGMHGSACDVNTIAPKYLEFRESFIPTPPPPGDEKVLQEILDELKVQTAHLAILSGGVVVPPPDDDPPPPSEGPVKGQIVAGTAQVWVPEKPSGRVKTYPKPELVDGVAFIPHGEYMYRLVWPKNEAGNEYGNNFKQAFEFVAYEKKPTDPPIEKYGQYFNDLQTDPAFYIGWVSKLEIR